MCLKRHGVRACVRRRGAEKLRIAQWNLGGVNMSPWEFKPLSHELAVAADSLLKEAVTNRSKPARLAKMMQEATCEDFLDAFVATRHQEVQTDMGPGDVLQVWCQACYGRPGVKGGQKIMSSKNLHLERFFTLEKITLNSAEELASMIAGLMTGSVSACTFFKHWLSKGLVTKSDTLNLDDPAQLWPAAAFDYAIFLVTAVAADNLGMVEQDINAALRCVLSSGFTTFQQKLANVQRILEAIGCDADYGPDIIAVQECDAKNQPNISFAYKTFAPDIRLEKTHQAVRLYVKRKLLHCDDEERQRCVRRKLAEKEFQKRFPVTSNSRGVSDLETKVALALIRAGKRQDKFLVAAIHADSGGEDGQTWLEAMSDIAKSHNAGVLVAMDANTKAGKEMNFKSFVRDRLHGSTCFDRLESGAGSTKKTRSWLQAQLTKADKEDSALKDWIICAGHDCRQKIVINGVRVNRPQELAREIKRNPCLPSEDNVYTETTMPHGDFSSDHCLVLADLLLYDLR